MATDSPESDKTQSVKILAAGTAVSHYEIISRIGAGGMGEVYLARDTKLGRKVALKFLAAHSTSDDDAHARFLNEARTAAALDHPNICPIYEIDEDKGQTFIAMAYIEGETISHKVHTHPLTVDEIQSIGIDIAQGLKGAHKKGVVHRDIKGANILITAEGQAKITDFGLAKLADVSKLTRTGVVLGTAAYMSPEQVRGESVDCRSDIWSLGVVLYEMVTGQLPFQGEKQQSVTHQILHHVAEPVTALRTGVPLDLERIIEKCLQKDARNRYQDADDLLVDLRNLDKRSIRSQSTRKGSRIWMPVALVLLAIAIVSVTWAILASNKVEEFKNPLEDATFRKLTDIEGYKDATISPDGKLVAFVSDHDGQFDIWVSQVETGSIYNRTKGLYGDFRGGLQDVGFSHNSSELLSFSVAIDPYYVKILPLIDGPPKRILRDSVVMAFWSPDGNSLVYYVATPGDPVFIADADGTSSQVLLESEPGMHNHYQRWSPDGEWIYMIRGGEELYDFNLWRVRRDGSGLEQLTEGLVGVSYPAPISNRMVLFTARDTEGAGPWLWAVDVETKTFKKVSFGLDEYSSISASQDGTRLAASIIDPEASTEELMSVPLLDTIATESQVTKIQLPVRHAQAPRYSEESLYFLSSTVGGNGLWKFENGQVQELWNGSVAALDEVPAVSLDGKTIAISFVRNGIHCLHTIDADGSNLRLLSDSVDIRGSFSFSPDGRWIVASGVVGERQGIYKVSTEDGHHELLKEEFAWDPIWSPKGDFIVYTGERISGFRALHMIRADGQEVNLPDTKVYVEGERYRFLPDGSGLVYMRGWVTDTNFWLLNLTTMKPRRLTRLAKGPTMRTFDISPDGKTIVFDRMRIKTKIVLIELADHGSRD